MRIIGLTGKMGVGKTTIVEIMRQVLNDEVNVVKFAQPLYDIQEFIYERISSVHERPKGFVKDRKLLQFLGTDWARQNINTNLWVDLWKIEVLNIERDFDQENLDDYVIVVDDVRFDNEAQAIKSMGGLIIKVESDKIEERIEVENTSHSSEDGVSEGLVDAYIRNNSTIEDLKQIVTHMFSGQFYAGSGF